MTFAVRNSLFLGVLTAIISRVIAIVVGLTSGYQGGWLDRVLMSINDTFVVLPLLPILILLGFLLRENMNLFYPPDSLPGAELEGAFFHTHRSLFWN